MCLWDYEKLPACSAACVHCAAAARRRCGGGVSWGGHHSSPQNNTAPHEGGEEGSTPWDAEDESGGVEGWRGGGVEEEIENTREGREGALAQCGGSPDGRVGLNGCVRERLQQRGVRVVRTEGRSVSSVCKCVCLCTACVCASVCAGGDGFVMKTAGSQRSRAPLCG